MPELFLIDREAVLGAISPSEAIDRVSDAFAAYARGEWEMPAKVYLPSPPHGDFRAMPARGAGLAIVKWVTSFPGNPGRGLPTVTGQIIVSDAETGEPLALVDGRAVTALRTGAVAPVATRAIRGELTGTVGVIGCGLHGGWVARCMAAAGFGPGVCSDVDADAAATLASQLDWQAGSLADALECDIVCTVTPGHSPVVGDNDSRPGRHFNALGADGPGKAEFSLAAVAACELFCDEWDQAAHGGELTGAVAAGTVKREDVVELGALIAGEEDPPPVDSTTLFDSTGLAIQDLAICVALMEDVKAGELNPPTFRL